MCAVNTGVVSAVQWNISRGKLAYESGALYSDDVAFEHRDWLRPDCRMPRQYPSM